MANNKLFVPVLVGMMLATGVTNTILTKLQDKQCIADCDSRRPKYFEQPVLQSLLMFVGESSCWLVIVCSWISERYNVGRKARNEHTEYTAVAASEQEEEEAQVDADEDENEQEEYTTMSSSQTLVDPTNLPAKALIDGEQSCEQRQSLTGWKVTLLALPAVCDIIGTTLMNVGMLFVAASIFQMTRGALVLFVGLLSIIFLKRNLSALKWASLFLVVAGVAIVGLAGALGQKSEDDATSEVLDFPPLLSRALEQIGTNEAAQTAGQTILGVMLIAGAQIFTASQFVLEESIMNRYVMDPIQVVSWEGTFGFVITAIGMVVLHAVLGRTAAGTGGYFDAEESFRELFTNKIIGITSLLYMFSIAGFNYFGLSVTRHISATARSTIDTTRVLFIWLVSLWLGWETFKWLQVFGFILLVYGTGIFNDVIKPPTRSWLRYRGARQNDQITVANNT